MTRSLSVRRRTVLSPAAILVGGALLLSACTSSGPSTTTTTTQTSGGASSTSTSTSTSTSPSPTKSVAPAKPVHVSLQMSDGAQVGVGMPIIAFLSRPIRDTKAFSAATKVTVNGAPVRGAWYFEPKSGLPGKPVEADYRLQNYWPGHASIRMNLPVKGLSAGKGLAFNNSLTLAFATGPANLLTVDDATHTVSVKSDGRAWGRFKTSLGATDTPTKRGIKVVMEQGASICMHGPGYSECGVKFTQRLTYDGEYLHAAPWNLSHIASGIDSSNGCTNLTTSDAKKLFDFLEIGDVVDYPNANGPRMSLGDGYGDWNLSWGQWQTGGLYATR